MIVKALQNKSTEFDSLSSDSSCPEIATAIENSNLSKNVDLLNQVPTNVQYYNSTSYETVTNKALGVSSGNLVANDITYTDYAELTLQNSWTIKSGDQLFVYGQYGASGGQGYRLGFIDENDTYQEIYGDFTNGGVTNSYKLFISLEDYVGKTIKKIKITLFPINAAVWVKLTQLRLCSQFQ